MKIGFMCVTWGSIAGAFILPSSMRYMVGYPRIYRERLTVNSANKANPESAEIVVIGSGLAGLSAAALLANQGRDVLLCESHYELGGCAHEFYYREDGTAVPSDRFSP